MKILIIGGTGGIGRAIIEYCLSNDEHTTVYATYHCTPPSIDHERVTWYKTDVSSEADVFALSLRLTKFDLLINAVGTLHSPDHRPEKSINEFDLDFFQHNFNANTVPTLLLSKHFALHLKAKYPTYFIALSARIGSIEDNRIGGWVSYRCSKAALNMAIKTISVEWKVKQPNCCIIAFHPGTTDTELSKPFQKNVAPQQLFSPRYVAHCLLDVIHNLTPENTGRFYSYSGEEIPW
ncbi:SDR family NAD(P)-dependent oxidoreductase [Vibrio zhugei]|uniref:SDR family NAD(P)-dependent oxidoreductase n=1 Tax=Vibrio zhugei TaxID=2479546 RepID=A0ABV7C6D6_9VIBR|nr:SDR family NAD(P)-dependent oxidoreductase [Vibrio zhugei]